MYTERTEVMVNAEVIFKRHTHITSDALLMSKKN